MVGILYCQKSRLDYNAIQHLLISNGIPACVIDVASASAENLSDCSILINAMGPYYVEENIGLLVDFFHSGKNILHLGSMPFTKNVTDEITNNRVLRGFGIVDDFVPIKENSSYVTFSKGMPYPTPALPMCLTGLTSAVYHLCETIDGENKRCAYLEPLLEAYNDNNELVAIPVIRVVTYDRGSMSFFNFDFSNDMLTEPFYRDLLLQVLEKELLGNLRLSVDSDFSLYAPTEEKAITIRVENINCQANEVELVLRLFNDGNRCAANAAIYEKKIFLTDFPYETTITLPSGVASSSSLYKIEATLCSGVVTMACKETGFLVLSSEEITSELAHFKPMYIDESVSSDYCLVDGKPTAILGTTHFVTDVYRECFYSMNAWLCDKELSQLQADGFNVLRSGNWVHIPEFYNADGSIGTRGIRALQTYFILAARHGFTVQFALGTILLNQWDRSRSPIHDAGMRQMCMNLVRSFAENFKDYPNVSLDIVNEPSYSVKGAWSPGRPSWEEGELVRYKAWLQEKYDTIEALRNAWGETSLTLKSFDDVTMPDWGIFQRGLCRTEQRQNHQPLADFFTFTRLEFSDWTGEIRELVRKIAPDMIVTMGRDETLRVPLQQDEVLAVNIDMVCWHQWNYNSSILSEYLLNRVRGKICVAQEMGMYRFDDITSGKRHSDKETAATLYKKLLYAHGNFVQWQAHDDPYMYELSENSLGLYRADKTPTPGVFSIKALIQTERNMQHLMYGREDEKIKILSVYNMSYYWTVDNSLAHQGIKNHITALCNHMHEQADFLPEHLFKLENASAIGNPKLIILPGIQTLYHDTWEELLNYVQSGATLLVNGCIDKDEHFCEDAKIGALDASDITYATRKLLNFEKLCLDGKEYVLDFRPVVGYADVTNLLDCGQVTVDDSTRKVAGNSITEYHVGQGTILYCPYPVELSGNMDAICALYAYAIEKAQASNDIYRIEDARPQMLLTAISYQACTVYTIVNEGFADSITFTDLRSGKTLTVALEENQGRKIWLDVNGEIL